MIKMTRHYVLAGRQTPARELRLDPMQALAELASFYLVPQAMQIAGDERKIELWRPSPMGDEILTFSACPGHLKLLHDFVELYHDDERLRAELNSRFDGDTPKLLAMKCNIMGPGRLAIAMMLMSPGTVAEDFTTASCRFSDLRELAAAIELLADERSKGGTMSMADLLAPANA